MTTGTVLAVLGLLWFAGLAWITRKPQHGSRLKGYTPVLEGEDARVFIEKMDAAVMTPERLKYLENAAEQSKKSEQRIAQPLA